MRGGLILLLSSYLQYWHGLLVWLPTTLTWTTCTATLATWIRPHLIRKLFILSSIALSLCQLFQHTLRIQNVSSSLWYQCILLKFFQRITLHSLCYGILGERELSCYRLYLLLWKVIIYAFNLVFLLLIVLCNHHALEYITFYIGPIYFHGINTFNVINSKNNCLLRPLSHNSLKLIEWFRER